MVFLFNDFLIRCLEITARSVGGRSDFDNGGEEGENCGSASKCKKDLGMARIAIHYSSRILGSIS